MPGPDPVVRPLQFDEAVRAFNRRAPHLVPTNRWTEMWQEEHSTAFTVSRSVGYDILGDIRDELAKALTGGETFEGFAKNLRPVLQAKGWWGTSQEDDGETVQLGSMSRLRTIYDTNLRQSYSAGAWERAQRTKSALPYLVYEGIRDSRQRPAHRAWTGTVKPVDDPWWNTHYPPCGFNCRCWVRQLSPSGMQSAGGITAKPASGPSRSFTNRSTGEVVQVPWGVDPGFAYNPGKAAMQGDSAANAAKIMGDKMAAAPARVAAEPIPPESLDAMAREFATWLEGVNAVAPKGDQRVVGALSHQVLDFLDKSGMTPSTGAITVTDGAIGHMMRDAKKVKVPELSTLKDLPLHLAHPDAVLWDKNKGNLVYVIALQDSKATRLIVELDRSVRIRDRDTGKRVKVPTNAIITGQIVSLQSLTSDKKYDLVEGSLK